MEAVPESGHLRRERRPCQVSSGCCPGAALPCQDACLGWRAAQADGKGANCPDLLLAQVHWTRPLEKWGSDPGQPAKTRVRVKESWEQHENKRN